MSEISVKILKKKITALKISIPENLPKKFKLKIESEAKVNTNSDESDNKFLVVMKTRINIPDNDEYEITCTSEILFEPNEKIDEFQNIIEEVCITSANENLFSSLDNILEEMGFGRLNLFES